MTTTISIQPGIKQRFLELKAEWTLYTGEEITVQNFFSLLLISFRKHTNECGQTVRKDLAEKLLRGVHSVVES